VLILTPTIRFLRTRFPEARIDVVVRRGTQSVLEGNPDLSRVFLMPGSGDDRGRGGESLADLIQTFRSLAGRRYDYAFDFSNSDRARLWMLLSFTKKRCAHNANNELGWKAFLYNVQLAFPWGHMHEVVKDFRLVADALGLPGEPGPLVISTDVDPAPIRERFPFLRMDRPRVILHPTSRWAFKQWLPGRWAVVADWLKQEAGFQVVFTCGPDAKEKAYLDTIRRCAGASHSYIRGEAALREIAWIIQQARLFVGVDTVAMHIASAVRTPVVALFGPSSEWSWRPWQTTHELVLGPCTCKQTRRFVCEKSRPYPCMEAISTAAVKEKIQRVLAHA
jgi:heptosyltransferase-3